jgi:hypothetical protein
MMADLMVDTTVQAPRTASPLRIRSLQLPADMAQLRPCVAELEPVLRVIISEAGCAANGQFSVFAAARQSATRLLTPWLAQTLLLPLRFGEKILRSVHIPAIRLTPLAPYGVLSESDAVALLRWLREHQANHAIVLTDVPTNTALYAGLSQAESMGYMLIKNDPDAHLHHRFRASFAEFFSELSTKYRTQLRKKEKAFGERLGTSFVLNEYRLPDEVKSFLDAANAINRQTYQFRLFGESVDNDGASVASGRRAALAGAFRSFILWHGDIPLCFILGHQRADGTYEHRQTGYDPAWRDIAPGIVCNLLMLRHLYAVDRPMLLDFGSGDADYKRLFSNESCMTANPVLVPRRPRYMLAVWTFRFFDTANALAVRTLQKLGLKEWIKRQLRRAN